MKPNKNTVVNNIVRTHLTLSYRELDAISHFFDNAYNEGTDFDRDQLIVAEKIDQFFLYYAEQSRFTKKLAELN